MSYRRLSTWFALLGLAAHGCAASEPAEQRTQARAQLVERNDFRSQLLTRGAMPLSRIALENMQAGTSAWQLEQPARAHEVEGYASHVSARSGDRVRLYVHVSTSSQVHYELYRMGYYQGFGGRFITSGTPRAVEPQPSCPADAVTGLVECHWTATFELSVSRSWVTGQYFFKLIRDDGFESYVPLVVREPAHYAPALVQSAVTTWQAYNVYGGSSLYRNNLPADLGFTRKHADAVSFNRPYTCQDLSSPDCQPGAGDFDLGERWIGRWLEQRGAEVAYVTNLDADLDGDPELLQDRRLYIAAGHDEYWPLGQRAALEQARAGGVSLAFLSANTGYWRVRMAADSDGRPRRTVYCYKDTRDPVADQPETTVLYRDAPNPRPEQSLLGVMYDDAASRTYIDSFAQVVSQADHWIYAGTGVRNGDTLSHVVGYEWDHAFDGDSAPAGREIIAHAELINVRGLNMPADVALYYPTDHSLVFGAGSIYWARGLSHPRYQDPRIERMLENVLVRAGIRLAPSAPLEQTHADDADELEVIAGPDATGKSPLSAPVGIALAPDGTIFVADNKLHAVLAISADGAVRTLAGCGRPGNANGVGRAACFNWPTGLVLTPEGDLIVSDTGNSKLRKISPDGTVTDLAGSGQHGKTDSGDPLTGQLADPRGIALAADGSLYIADSGASNLRKLDASGLHTVSPGSHPTAIAVADDGTMYVSTTRGGTIDRCDANGLTAAVGRRDQYGDADGAAKEARLRPADGIALDGARVVFTDSANHKLRVWDPETDQVSTLAGDGHARVLQMPRGVVVSADGFIVADTGNHRVVRVPRR